MNVKYQTIQGRAAVCALFCAIILTAGSAHAFSFGEGMSPGSYAVGFKTIEKFDYQRPFLPKRDYFGEPRPGERFRPIQIGVWYPAEPSADAEVMVYGEYAFPHPGDSRFFDFLSQIQNRESAFLGGLFRNAQGVALDLMSAELGAVRDAPPKEGSFPLIVFQPDMRNGITENAVLCELLASHGYVVASTHSFGSALLNPEASAAELETLVRDMEFVIGVMQDFPQADRDNLGVLGSGHGGSAALLLRMRNGDIEAVATLNGSYLHKDNLESVTGNPWFAAELMPAPLLQLYNAGDEDLDLTVTELLVYATRYALDCPDTRALDFTNYGLASTMAPDSIGPDAQTVRSRYSKLCGHVRDFFDAFLKDEETGLKALNDALPGGSSNAASGLVRRELPPTPGQFRYIVETYDALKAAQIFDKFRAMDPTLILFQEMDFNARGYRLMSAGRNDEALQIMRMNAETYPRSANVWDSYGDACLAIGNDELALKNFRKVLEVLPADSTTPEAFKQQIQTGTQEKIERLEGGSSEN